MQSSSQELSTLVAISIYIYIYIYIYSCFIYAEDDNDSAVRYPTGVKLAWFQSQLEASHVSSHTEEL